ncbi:MAG: ABC transporter permease [Solirubrobacterales bacterium]
MSFPEFLESRSEEVIRLTLEHAEVVAISILIATLIAVAVGVAVYRRERASQLALGIAAVFLTIPSFALLGLLIAPLGLGYPPTLFALVMYALLPILRNTVTGLRGIDGAVLESARGMGMSDRRRLLRIELPLAWPVILTGIRVSTLIVLGVAAIAAAINGPGLGEFIFRGIGRIGAVNALNEMLTGVLGVMVLAILFDLAFFGLRRATTSPGVR